MANIRDNLDEAILHVGTLKKALDEYEASAKDEEAKQPKRELRPDNASSIVQEILGALKQDTLMYQSYIDTIAMISPGTSAYIQKLLESYEKERIRITDMFDETFLKGFKEPSIEWTRELNRMEKETKPLLSLGDYMDELITIAYDCFGDMIKFLEK